MVLDEKTEKIAALEKEIVLKGQQIIGNEQQIRDLQHKNEWVYLYIYKIWYIFENHFIINHNILKVIQCIYLQILTKNDI